MSGRNVRIAMLGCGTIGKGVARLLASTSKEIERKTGLAVELAYVVELPAVIDELKKDAEVPVSPEAWCSDVQKMLDDKSVEIVIELIGGYGIAKDFTLKALAAGKHVVTANKAMIAMFGREICAQARSSGVSITFEASCGGGIPLISSIQRGLIANEIRGIYGILNGTCNYILSEMHGAVGKSYAQALSEAQEQGFAEPDPRLDVSGVDTAHKIAVLASLSFGVSVDFDRISVDGIETLDIVDIRAGQELGYVCKLLAIAENRDGLVNLRVHPTFIRRDHPLAGVSGPFNAVSIYGSQVGHTMYYGRGAGPSPTASAILADVIDAALGNAGRAFEQLPIFPDVTPAASYKSIEDVTVRYYFRINVVDRPGMMAGITKIFGDQGISLSAVNQHEASADAKDNVVPIAVLTHLAREGDVRAALAKIESMKDVREKPVCIRLMEEPSEF